MHAYCYASGHIGFGDRIPEGALPLARGRAKPLQDFISGVARHAYDGDTLLVPGIPEARNEDGEPDQDKALDALQKFRAWIDKKPPKGVTVR